MRQPTRRGSLVAATAIMLAACSGGHSGTLETPATVSTTTSSSASTAVVVSSVASATTTSATTTTLSSFATDRAPNGRAAPRVADTAAGLAAQLIATERGLRDLTTPSAQLDDLGHLNQLVYRTLSTKPAWDAIVLAVLPDTLRPIASAHINARREFLAMRATAGDTVPDWEIIAPKPIDTLVSYYKEAETATGIGWQYLAAINLVETGLGRVNGLSVSGATGPMQFLPTTWAETGIGKGDIRDAHDAIQAAARYLVRRGGPNDMAKALLGYNNHANYVRAVTAYADLFKADEQSFRAAYHWEVYFLSELGDVWLPVGYHQTARIPVRDYLKTAPWSAPPPGAFVPAGPGSIVVR